MQSQRAALLVIAVIGLPVCSWACQDDNSGCGSWADNGECSKNKAFMETACAESCGYCTPLPLLDTSDDPLLGEERVVMQVQFGSPPSYGELVLGFYPTVAPVTVAHILKLVRMGGYNTNEIFRVDKGFVAQVQGVAIGDFSSAAPLPACHPLHHDLTLRSSHHGRCKVWMAVGELQ